nr:uncharacterized protein LOC112284524 isoform X2 [Physcomitrium patens]|eukprot:XP_024380167.1 uncharacterized protein LOC112284524 isoform X2 [Physcomitrella patens]
MIMTCQHANSDVLTKNIKSGKTSRVCSLSPKHDKTSKNDLTRDNVVCVKKIGKKDFTICLSKLSQSQVDSNGKLKPKMPMSIIIHSSPKCKVDPHPCFETLADKKSNAVVNTVKKKLSYTIDSPADNLKISLMGDSLDETFKSKAPLYPMMLLKGGGHGSVPNSHTCQKFSNPQAKCSFVSPDTLDSSNSQGNDVNVNLPRTGVKLNIKIKSNDVNVNYGSPTNNLCSPKIHDSPKYESKICDKSCNKNERSCPSVKLGGYLQPTISSTIANRNEI